MPHAFTSRCKVYHGGLFFSELDPHIQLNDVEPIDKDQYEQFEDKQDGHHTERDDTEPDDTAQDNSEADEVHTIYKETQERCSPQTSHANCCDFSPKFDEPSQPKLKKFPENTKFPSKKRDLSTQAGTTASTG